MGSQTRDYELYYFIFLIATINKSFHIFFTKRNKSKKKGTS